MTAEQHGPNATRCQLGDDWIASIDIDPTLVDSARRTLGDLGYQPTLTAGNGHYGFPDGAPYDAIIVQVAFTP